MFFHGCNCSEKDEEEEETSDESCSKGHQELTEFGVHGSVVLQVLNQISEVGKQRVDINFVSGAVFIELQVAVVESQRPFVDSHLRSSCVDCVEERTLSSMPLVYTLCLHTVNPFHPQARQLGSVV